MLLDEIVKWDRDFFSTLGIICESNGCPSIKTTMYLKHPFTCLAKPPFVKVLGYFKCYSKLLFVEDF